MNVVKELGTKGERVTKKLEGNGWQRFGNERISIGICSESRVTTNIHPSPSATSNATQSCEHQQAMGKSC
jgi:hypothetical protein